MAMSLRFQMQRLIRSIEIKEAAMGNITNREQLLRAEKELDQQYALLEKLLKRAERELARAFAHGRE